MKINAKTAKNMAGEICLDKLIEESLKDVFEVIADCCKRKLYEKQFYIGDHISAVSGGFCWGRLVRWFSNTQIEFLQNLGYDIDRNEKFLTIRWEHPSEN